MWKDEIGCKDRMETGYSSIWEGMERPPKASSDVVAPLTLYPRDFGIISDTYCPAREVE